MKLYKESQRGVALVVTLVLLIVALLLGLSSYQSSRLDESMAGNQRASSLALMAAEYGASDVWYEVGPALSVDAPKPEDYEDYNSYMEAILQSFYAWMVGSISDSDGEENALIGQCKGLNININGESGTSLGNSCYTVSAGEVFPNYVSIYVDGMVYSGNASGVEFDSGRLSALPESLLARRTIALNVKVVLGESLSPLNFVGELGYYNGIDSQATLEGEEVDGYVNPAVSVYSKEEARKIVQDIIGKNKSIDDFAVFVPSDPACQGSECDIGVYHAKDVVNTEVDPPVYDGNYENCTTANNSLCNYKGGIASTLGAPILSKPGEFDNFVNAAVSGIQDKDTYWMSGAEAKVFGEDGDRDVYFVTNQNPSVGYSRPVWDEFYLREGDSDLGMPDRMERPLMDLGGFNKSGVLIIDGDVEFDGNPEFEGLIIVLGDYNINGSGKDPFTGAIISAPYSMHYTDGGGNDLVPFRDVNGNLLDGAGNLLEFNGQPVGSEVRVVSDVVYDSDNNPEYTSYVVDSSGNLLAGVVPYYSPAGCHSLDCNPAPLRADAVDNSNVERRFDPLGVNINGGGKQPYIYDYQVVQGALSLLSEEAQLLFLVGQSRPDGTYEYGVSAWGEILVPPKLPYGPF